MIDVVTHSYDNINDGLFTGIVLVDLKKAFDTVSHKTLMLKLRNYGIHGVAFGLLNSYPTGNSLYVSIIESFHVKSTKIEKKIFAVVSIFFKFLPLGDMFK